MTTETEVTFDFSEVQELADKKAAKRLKKQRTDDASYLKNRGTILAKAREKTLQSRPVSRLRNAWAKAWDELPDEQKNVVDAAHSEAALLWCEINDALKNMAAGIAHIQAPFINLTFEAGKEFMAKQVGGGVFPYVDFAAHLSPEDFDAQTDANWKSFGRFTTLPTPVWHNFLAVALAYVNSHLDQFEESFRLELESLVPNHFQPTPAPAQIIGLKQSTRSEETARETTKEFIKTQQQIGGITL